MVFTRSSAEISVGTEISAETLYKFVADALTAIARSEGKPIESVFAAKRFVVGD